VKCDFNVTIDFPNFENFGVGVEFSRVGEESESEIRDSAHLWCSTDYMFKPIRHQVV